ncbi:ubiquitin thioesterase trabid [Nilaparvata lugens]|uniref:ubiquitin thioesterase trabid n=1 Tax=Nilaparvata lugens TaxID=108931 RepID=UPI00193CD20D|nr:ubiquitin thioesterase trabid [Nilaparvata lugens]XP_039291546.1 ubiquitin thioesterase trabid [Nilaparvata lugens]
MCDDSSVQKWTCEYCTFANFPSALKCTMCRGAKPLLNENIFRLRDEGSASSGSSAYEWPTAAEECSNSRPTNDATDLLQEGLKPLRISDHSDAVPSAASSVDSKWSCSVCTYENWPKATRCVMCATPPPHPRLSPTAEGATNRHASNNSEQPNNLTASLRRSASRRIDESGGRAMPDWVWLDACLGVVQGECTPVDNYLSGGGDPTRQLTAKEVALLDRPSAFDTGHTLVHLAIRFHREDMLATLLSRMEGSGSGVKRVPSYVAPDLAADIRRHAAATLRHRKANPPIPFFTELATFALPAEIVDLPQAVTEQLFEELLDKDAQQQLEADPPVINWSIELTVHLGSRLYALWNRSAGDCLLDSLMQATLGVFDRDNLLRRALSDSLTQAGHVLYARWREYESWQARLMHYSLDESQWEQDWATLQSLATRPGCSLEQLHVFALAHVLRRPILVYGVKYVKSFRGEDIGYARFQGVYLPLLWDTSFCIRSPVALGYTRGHFSALVAIEPEPPHATTTNHSAPPPCHFLPLVDHDGKLLPIHFVTHAEAGGEEALLRQWMDVCLTDNGLLVAKQRLNKRPLLVAQMLEEWLNHYRRLAQMSIAPMSARPIPVQDYSSDGDSDDE